MARSQQLQHLDPDVLEDLKDLRELNEEALRELGEKSKALEIAKNLLPTGVPLEQIATVTGLSLEEVQSLTTS